MRGSIVCFSVAAVLVLGCDGEVRGPGVVVHADALDTVLTQGDTGHTEADTPGPGLDTLPIDVPEAPLDGLDTFVDETGGFGPGFGQACTANGDCVSGLCVHGKDGDVCTVPCVDACPAGFSCKQLVLPSRDTQFACLPEHVTLCRPCTDAATCVDGGYQPKAYCADLGAVGHYCLTPCDAATPCPSGFSCASPAGKTGTWCTPDTDACACDAVASAQGLGTACALVNEAGSCPGDRACGESGLSACVGRTPAAETCNNLDDNCDGETDEGFDTKGTACDGPDLDGCADGKVVCGDEGLACADDAASVNEACENGKDDDCDGETDEGCCNAPGSPCCAEGACSAPLSCVNGYCACSQKASAVCVDGDAWYADCNGLPTLAKAECGGCGCVAGECDTTQPGDLLCVEGDVHASDCLGTELTLAEDCGLCGCFAGSCLATDEAGTTCDSGDSYWTECDGTLAAKKTECGACGCTGGKCSLSDEASIECFQGDAWFVDCFGVPTGKEADCGSCACSAGECQVADGAGPVCSEGDAWNTNCDGEITTKAADCGSCACEGGACVANAQAGKVCFESDVWAVDCGGNRTTKASDCGGCGCTAGSCNVDDQAGTTCFEGDSWWLDCNGQPSGVAEDCGGCACSNGACEPDAEAGLVCQDGDAHYLDCKGVVGALSADCGACGCSGGTCLVDNTVGAACIDGDAWWLGCQGQPTSEKAECDGCACEGGACIENAQASIGCYDNDVYNFDCHGNKASLATECGACGCSGGACNVNNQATKTCQGGDVYYRDCNGSVTTKAETCACGCSSGACLVGACTWDTTSFGSCPQNAWQYSGAGSCSAPCGAGSRWMSYTCPTTNNVQTRTVSCRNGEGVVVADASCPDPKPATSQSCLQTTCSGGDPSYPQACNEGACVTCPAQTISVNTGSYGGAICTDTLAAYTGPAGAMMFSPRSNGTRCQGPNCVVTTGCGETPYFGTVSGGTLGTCLNYCAVRATCTASGWTDYSYTW